VADGEEALPVATTDADKRKNLGGVRLRKYIDVTVEDVMSYTLLRAAVADISPTGMRILTDQYLPKGTKYTFSMKRFPMLVMRGEVRWVRPFERDTFQVGVLFIDVDVDTTKRLIQFLDIERTRTAASA
jgi:hypothetical protein